MLLHFVLGSDLLMGCYLEKIELSLILYLKTKLFSISLTLLYKVLTSLSLKKITKMKHHAENTVKSHKSCLKYQEIKYYIAQYIF